MARRPETYKAETDLIRRLMRSFNIASDSELARRMGVHPSRVSRMFNDEPIGMAIVMGLCKVFPELKLTDLVKGPVTDAAGDHEADDDTKAVA